MTKLAVPRAMQTRFLPAERSTEAEILEAAATLSENALLTSLLETVPGGAMVLDPNRRIVTMNGSLCQTLHLTGPGDALGKRPGELFGCQNAQTEPGGCGTSEGCRHCGLIHTLLQAAVSDATARGECRIAQEDGGTLELAIAAHAQQVAGARYIFVGMQDTSSTKRRELLERTFFHDVLNTAGGVLGLMELLRQGTAPSPDWAETTHGLVRSLVDEIRAQRQLLAAEVGDLSIDIEAVDVAELMSEAVALYRVHSVCHDRKLELSVGCRSTLQTDRRLLRRVLGNMIKNALEASPPGSTVVAAASQEDGRVVLQVKNPGVMPPEVQRQMFQRSFSTKGVGRGIGTYSMKLFGERYLGGQLSFSSHASSGTTFTLRLSPNETLKARPLVDQLAPYQATGLTETLLHAPAVTELPLAGLHALVVDDQRVNQLVAKALLKRLGASADVTADGLDALEATQARSYDLLLVDLHMPRMDGLELTRRLRANEFGQEHVPIFALTAADSEQERKACMEAGVDGVLSKPLQADKLVSLLSRLRSTLC